MTPDPYIPLRGKFAQALVQVRQYRSTPLYAALVELLAAAEDCYKEELLTAPAESVRFKQGAAAQVRLLRNALVHPVDEPMHDLPKV